MAQYAPILGNVHQTTLLIVASVQSFFIVFLLPYYPQFYTVNDVASVKKPISETFNISSSVYCYGKFRRERQCRFQNLCFSYAKQEYVFIKTNSSYTFGLPENYNHHAPLLDLSSVDNHTAMYFSYKEISFQSIKYSNINFINTPSILFKRFNPENIMHVLHDDLIPLYITQRKFYLSNDQLKLIMMEGREKGPYYELYEIISTDHLMLNDMKGSDLTCFRDVVVGICKDTIWYQYGFYKPQSPLDIEFYPPNQLQYFRDYFLYNLDFEKRYLIGSDTVDKDMNYVLYFSRTLTRKIINEGKLVLKLSFYFGMAVQTVSLEHDNLFYIIQLISKAAIVIGMHGAHLSLATFMKENTTLIELFPFGIPSSNYQPYKTLAKLRKLKYIAWENKDESNTITHEDWPPNYGGIDNLSPQMQQHIRDTKSVPLHLCCSNPYWLFRVYQDTIVDIDNLLVFLQDK